MSASEKSIPVAGSVVAEVRSHRSDGVGYIVVANEARRNALTMAMKQQLLDAFARHENDPDVGCVVLGGAGAKSFISGADISEFAQYRTSPAAEAAYLELSTAAMMAPARARKPVVASIRGACAGGGLQIAVACDIRIAARSAFFMMPAARLGVGYPYQSLSLFVALLGRGKTADLFMSARRVPAEEALDMGLVNRVVDDEALDAEVAAYAQTVAGHAPLSLALVKQSIASLAAVDATSPPEMDQLLQACSTSADAIEGRNAFLEKRKPSFHGR